MSNKKRRNRKIISDSSEASGQTINQPFEEVGIKDSETRADQPNASRRTGLISHLKSNLMMVGIIAFLTLGVVASGLKYLDEEAQREVARRANNKSGLNNQQDQSFLNKINPFLSPPDPPPTPQLSREYIYAGSRLLAVEDANASAAPPADLAIWRKTTGEWWVMGSGENSHQVTQQWGVSTDKAVPGDYDGDGKTDFAVWRPADGTWYIINSGGGGGAIPFGQNGDKVAQADYDGDGKTDAAIYRSGIWYIQQSSDYQTVTVQFGLASDIPAPADYNGDGKADIVVWRNGDTRFYVRTGAQTYDSVLIGVSSTEPVSADYDGDGKANFAVKSGADWAIMNSAVSQVQTTSWQSSGDLPVQNDYDGDGKVDIAVWHDANGTWYIKNSSDNSTRIVQWGVSGDTPVPAYYRR